MASDPGFSSDSCIFMEAQPGDNGVHNSSAVWWLSPDITLEGPSSGLDQADAGQINKVRVRFQRKPASSQCAFPGAESITVEVWVANPSLAMIPDNSASSRRIGFIGSPLPSQGASGIQPIDWTPRLGLPASHPESKGHKCLIARAYPDNLTPSATKFFVPDDQHVVQHNLSVIACTGVGTRPCTFNISTVNPQARLALPRVKLKAAFDSAPTDFVRSTVLKRLQSMPGFQSISTQPPLSFGFDLSGIPQTAGLIQLPPGPTVTTATTTETQVNISGRPVTFQFFAKFINASGLAYIFHIIQTGMDNTPQGGLTLVMLTV